MPVLPLSGKVFARTCLRRVRPIRPGIAHFKGGRRYEAPSDESHRSSAAGIASLVSLRRENFVECTKTVAAQKSIVDCPVQT